MFENIFKDIIYSIFIKLPAGDCLQLAKTCKRFYNIFLCYRRELCSNNAVAIIYYGYEDLLLKSPSTTLKCVTKYAYKFNNRAIITWVENITEYYTYYYMGRYRSVSEIVVSTDLYTVVSNIICGVVKTGDLNKIIELQQLYRLHRINICGNTMVAAAAKHCKAVNDKYWNIAIWTCREYITIRNHILQLDDIYMGSVPELLEYLIDNKLITGIIIPRFNYENMHRWYLGKYKYGYKDNDTDIILLRNAAIKGFNSFVMENVTKIEDLSNLILVTMYYGNMQLVHQLIKYYNIINLGYGHSCRLSIILNCNNIEIIRFIDPQYNIIRSLNKISIIYIINNNYNNKDIFDLIVSIHNIDSFIYNLLMTPYIVDYIIDKKIPYHQFTSNYPHFILQNRLFIVSKKAINIVNITSIERLIKYLSQYTKDFSLMIEAAIENNEYFIANIISQLN